jgi:hypothetical protein
MPIRHKNIVYIRDIAPIGGVRRPTYMNSLRSTEIWI